jgi:putative flippase GtrA
MVFFTSLYKRVRRLARELAKFGSVGAMAFVVTAGFFNLFRYLGFGPLTSVSVATVIAATFSYFANRFWTFRHRDNNASDMGREYVLFFALNGIGLAITQIFIGFTHYVLHLEGGLADNGALVIGTGFATMFRYYAYKRWVFRKPAPKAVPVAVSMAVPVPAMAGAGPLPAPVWSPPPTPGPVTPAPAPARAGFAASRSRLLAAVGAVAAAVVIGTLVFVTSSSQPGKASSSQPGKAGSSPSVSRTSMAKATTVEPEWNLLPKSAVPACDPAYRAPRLCVPYRFPSRIKTVQDKCRWLVNHGFKKIAVRGKDRQRLDRDKNGIACDR